MNYSAQPIEVLLDLAFRLLRNVGRRARLGKGALLHEMRKRLEADELEQQLKRL